MHTFLKIIVPNFLLHVLANVVQWEIIKNKGSRSWTKWYKTIKINKNILTHISKEHGKKKNIRSCTDHDEIICLEIIRQWDNQKLTTSCLAYDSILITEKNKYSKRCLCKYWFAFSYIESLIIET